MYLGFQCEANVIEDRRSVLALNHAPVHSASFPFFESSILDFKKLGKQMYVKPLAIISYEHYCTRKVDSKVEFSLRSSG